MDKKQSRAQALKRLDSIENEAKELRKIISVKDGAVTDRIKTFEDALDEFEIGEDVKELLDYNGTDEDMLGALAMLKLTIISKALNEGWKPDWTDQAEYKYYPWFEYKKVGSGFGFSGTGYDFWAASTRLSALAFALKHVLWLNMPENNLKKNTTNYLTNKIYG